MSQRKAGSVNAGGFDSWKSLRLLHVRTYSGTSFPCYVLFFFITCIIRYICDKIRNNSGLNAFLVLCINLKFPESMWALGGWNVKRSIIKRSFLPTRPSGAWDRRAQLPPQPVPPRASTWRWCGAGCSWSGSAPRHTGAPENTCGLCSSSQWCGQAWRSSVQKSQLSWQRQWAALWSKSKEMTKKGASNAVAVSPKCLAPLTAEWTPFNVVSSMKERGSAEEVKLDIP